MLRLPVSDALLCTTWRTDCDHALNNAEMVVQALDVAQATPPLSSTNGNGARAPGVAMESRDRSDWGFAAGQRGPLLDTVVQRLQRFGTYGRLKQVNF